MKFSQPITLEQAADFLQCDFVGAPNHEITGLNEIHVVEPGDVVFVDFEKYYDKAIQSAATTILIDKKVDCPEGKGLLISESPFDDFNKLIKRYRAQKEWNITPGENFSLGHNSRIDVNVSIGNNVRIGDNCIIYPGVVIYDNVTIGNNVVIQANSVIGSHAFYYKKKDTGYDRLLTAGGVILGDRVEIGAGTTIDSGVTSNTIIGAGTKFDNHIHVGHDVVIGKNCLFAAHVGIAGCVVIKDNVTLWGQVGVVSDVVIAEGTVVYGQSGISKATEPGKTYLGSPAIEARDKFKEMAALRKLPIILENL